jgi:GlcNAc-P-P-Und epimerase
VSGQYGRVFVTGGSGFIGTNLVQYFLDRGAAVVNFDYSPPRNPAHVSVWKKGDIRESSLLADAISDFDPQVVLHAAARTDLNGLTTDHYLANSVGVENMIAAARLAPHLQRIVFFSSMLVCEFGYVPHHESEYCATTAYGHSKVFGERLVREVPISSLPWVLVRPTSIWGPWFGAPYRTLFEALREGWFVAPRGTRAVVSYGYVGNLVAQVAALVAAPAEDVAGKTYYLADYEPLELSDWTNAISAAWGKGKVRQVPASLLRLLAKCGDVMQHVGWRNPPLTTFRLKNLSTSAVFDMTTLAKCCPNLPFSVNQGICATIGWLRSSTAANRVG